MIKQIVLLALSSRDGGICVAGKDIATGKWLRPVSPSAGVPYHQVTGLVLGDIINLDLTTHKPESHQTENYLYKEAPWKKVGHKKRSDLAAYLDTPGNIWFPTGLTQQNKYLTPAEIKTSGTTNSLYFISVPKLAMNETAFDGKPKYYGHFDYKGTHYQLPIKDQAFIEEYKRTGNTMFSDPLICCSLAGPFEICGEFRCYKLIAGVIK